MSDLNKTLCVADRNDGVDALLEGRAMSSNTGVSLARFIPLAKSDADHLRPDYRHVRKIEIFFVRNADLERADVVEGADGDDLPPGGMSTDILNGGAGQDFMYGSRTGAFVFAAYEGAWQ